MEKKYNFLFVGNFQTVSVGEPEIAKSLEALGHTVTRVTEGTTDLAFLGKEVKKHDILLFAKFRVGNYVERKEFLKNLEIPSVCWMFDLMYGL